MAVGIGAANFMGVALETVSGTWVTPAKFFPFRTESLQWVQATNWRRVIAQTADVLGAVEGDGHVEGDIDMELLHDVLPHLLQAARGTLAQSGVDPANVYDFTPSHAATPSDTLSITIVRNGVTFGYVGCVIASQAYSVDNGQAVVTLSVLGQSEASQALPTLSLDDSGPFGSGSWIIKIPTAAQVFDTDNLTLTIDDSGEPQVRLRDELGAQFIKYGERTTTLAVERDFESRAEYDAFKALTAKSITVRVQKAADATKYVEFVVPAAIVDTYEMGTPGVGDLQRASVSYMGTHHTATGASYTIEIGTDEDLGL
jgi:hypothetical protein